MLTFVTSPSAFRFADGRTIEPGDDDRFKPVVCEVAFSEFELVFCEKVLRGIGYLVVESHKLWRALPLRPLLFQFHCSL